MSGMATGRQRKPCCQDHAYFAAGNRAERRRFAKALRAIDARCPCRGACGWHGAFAGADSTESREAVKL